MKVKIDKLVKNPKHKKNSDKNLIEFLKMHREPYIITNQENKGITKKKHKFIFSHDLIKSKSGDWYVVDHLKRVEQPFKNFRTISFKLQLNVENSKIEICPTDLIVKYFHHNNEDIFSLHNKLQEYFNPVVEEIDFEDKYLTISTNKGPSLDGLLPYKDKTNYPFDFRLQLAIHICQEIQTLRNFGLVHNNLKPKYLCIDIVNSLEIAKVTVIDFKFANYLDSVKKVVKKISFYIPPEDISSNQNQVSRHESDIFSLAGILAEVFGATASLKHKKEIYEQMFALSTSELALEKMTLTDYCLEGIFEGCNVSYIDPHLLDSIKSLLSEMQNSNWSLRPSIELVLNFFTLFTERNQEFLKFKTEWQKFIEILRVPFSGYPKYRDYLKHLSNLRFTPKPFLELCKNMMLSPRDPQLSTCDKPYPDLTLLKDKFQSFSDCHQFNKVFLIAQNFSKEQDFDGDQFLKEVNAKIFSSPLIIQSPHNNSIFSKKEHNACNIPEAEESVRKFSC